MGTSWQRREDWSIAYQVRPVVLELDGRRLTISPHETQLLLDELGRLTGSHYRAAEGTAAKIVDGRAAGRAISLGDGAQRCLIRSVEGVRARRSLPGGLVRLRELLLHSPGPLV